MLKRHVGWVRERIEAKSEKTYPPHTILLVSLHSEMILDAEVWGKLVAQCRSHVDRSVFEGVFIVSIGSKLVAQL